MACTLFEYFQRYGHYVEGTGSVLQTNVYMKVFPIFEIVVYDFDVNLLLIPIQYSEVFDTYVEIRKNVNGGDGVHIGKYPSLCPTV